MGIKMGKFSWRISALLVCSLIALTGCATEVGKEQEEVGQEENEQVKDEEPIEIVQIDEPAPVPVHVNVEDPVTGDVLRTIVPETLGFGTNNDKYQEELAEWAKLLARGSATEPGYDQRNIPDRIDENGDIVKGRPMVVLEEKELVERIVKASKEGGDIELPLYITESGYKEEDVTSLDEVVVASYTTYFNRGVVGRNKNIELSAKAIDNVILGVGDHFSFNDTVGPSDAEHGYQPAQEIVNKELVMGIGGGICQTSSTLFNAVDKVGVDYVEWHHHSLSVGYVPEGRDATVSYGGKDFRFLNTTGVPLLINAVYGDGTLTVEVKTSKEYAKEM